MDVNALVRQTGSDPDPTPTTVILPPRSGRLGSSSNRERTFAVALARGQAGRRLIRA